MRNFLAIVILLLSISAAASAHMMGGYGYAPYSYGKRSKA